VSTIIARMLGHALRGQGAHVEVTSAIDGLDWQLAGVRPPDAPHSVFRVLNHMIFWQEIYLQRLTGASAPSPARAAAQAAARPAPPAPTTSTSQLRGSALTRASYPALPNPKNKRGLCS
jgi:hypothetical protein